MRALFLTLNIVHFASLQDTWQQTSQYRTRIVYDTEDGLLQVQKTSQTIIHIQTTMKGAESAIVRVPSPDR